MKIIIEKYDIKQSPTYLVGPLYRKSLEQLQRVLHQLWQNNE